MSKRRFIENSWRKEPWFRSLVAAIKTCKNEEEIANLMRDVATLSELQAMSERLEVATLLSQGKSYRDISSLTGASTTTVTRVASFLENGAGGYRKVLNAHRHHRMVSSMPKDSSQHAETEKPHGERSASALQKYLGKAK